MELSSGDIQKQQKRCPKCKNWKDPDSDFTKCESRKDGKDIYCRDCKRNLCVDRLERRKKDPILHEEHKKRDREYRRTSPVAKARQARYSQTESCKLTRKKAKIKNKYGMKWEEFVQLFNIQEGKCATCKDPLSLLKGSAVDHSHETGRVRGILCHPCNRGLGSVRDDTRILKSMISYLESQK